MITPVKYDKYGSSIELKKLMTKGNMENDQDNIRIVKVENDIVLDGDLLAAGDIDVEGNILMSDENYIGISGAERIHFDSAGDINFLGCNVGINEASPGEKLSIDPGEDVSAEIGEAHVGYVGYGGYAGFSHVDRNSAGNYALLQHSNGQTYLNCSTGTHIYFRENNATHMEMNDQGGCGVGASPATTACHIRASNDIVAFYSDERLKEKITIGIENPIDKIKNINTFTYRHNELANTLGFVDDKIYIGVGAQSVKDSLPEAVEIAPFDIDEDGNSKSGEDYLTVQYERLVPLLIEGIKDQQGQIDDLKQQIEEIKNGSSK